MKITEAIKEVGRPVQFYPSLARVFGLEESVFIGQMLYWKGKEGNPEKGIKKSASEIESETSLSYRQQKRIKPKLKNIGVISYEYDRKNHDTYYIINEECVDSYYQEHRTKCPMPQDEKSHGIGRKVSSSIHRVHIDDTESIAKETFAKNQINEFITFFEEVNPSYETLFRNKTERKASEEMIQKFGIEKLKPIVEIVLPKMLADKYSKGKSTKPTEMQRNLGLIKAWVEQNQNKKDNVTFG